jgi:hypothetical protein
MERTPEVEQVLRIVREVVSQRFRGDSWIFHGAPLMQADRDHRGPGQARQVLNHEPDAVVDAIWASTALASTAAVRSLVFIARARSFGLVK